MRVALTILRGLIVVLTPLAVTLTSCIPEPLEVDGVPQVKPRIVVISQFIPDESLVILLTRTFGALEASEDSDPTALLAQIAVTDATVTITGPEGSYPLQPLGGGAYGGVEIPFRDGSEYRLEVISVLYGEVFATATAQAQIPFRSIDVSLYGVSANDTLAEVSQSFQDPRGSNWYMINVDKVEREDLIEDIINPRSFTRLIDDSDFDGELYDDSFRVFPRNYYRGDTVAVFLSNISKEYYDFMKLREDNRFSFVEYLGEPVNYPSNVEGGLGFFNLYIPDIRVFVLGSD